MTKTANDVIIRALQVLRVIGPGEDADASVYQQALDTYQVYHNELLAEVRDLYSPRYRSWDYNAVPDEIWINIAFMLAGRLMNIIPVPSDREAVIAAQADVAENGLKNILSRRKQSFSRFDAMPGANYPTYRT